MDLYGFDDPLTPTIRWEETSVTKKKKTRAGTVYLHVRWEPFAQILRELSADRPTRLLIALLLSGGLDRARPDTWLEPKRWMLQDLGINDKNYHRAVDGLEQSGLVEVDRRVGKRPRLRLRPRPDEPSDQC